MSYFRIIPDELIDWIEQRKNPERYYRLVILLLRLSNWGNGTYNDGVEVKRGQVRITLRKLAQRTGYSLTAIHKLLKRLSSAGWISISNQNSLTIVTLHWLYEGEHLKASKVNTKNPKGEQQGKQETASYPTDSFTNGKQQGEQETAERCTPKTAEGEIRNIRSNKEIKETEIKEEKNTYTHNKACDRKTEDSDFEEKKEKLKEFREEVKEEIKESSGSKNDEENDSVTDAHIRATVERIKDAFRTEYTKRYKKTAIISVKATHKLFQDLKESCKTVQELKKAEDDIIPKIPVFFRSFKDDKFVQERRYDFVAFVHRLPQLLNTYERDGSIEKQESYEFEEVRL